MVDADAIQEKAMMRRNLAVDINSLMKNLPTNDCGISGNEFGQDPGGARITLGNDEWRSIQKQSKHPLHMQANRWPCMS